MKNKSMEFLVSTFNDGVNNIYNIITVDRWYDSRHDDFVFTFNGEIEYLSNNASFMNIVKEVFGDRLLDAKLKGDSIK